MAVVSTAGMVDAASTTGFSALGDVLLVVRVETGVDRPDGPSVVEEAVLTVVVVAVAGGASAASRFLASLANKSGSAPLAPGSLKAPIPPIRVPTVGAGVGTAVSYGETSVAGGGFAADERYSSLPAVLGSSGTGGGRLAAVAVEAGDVVGVPWFEPPAGPRWRLWQRPRLECRHRNGHRRRHRTGGHRKLAEEDTRQRPGHVRGREVGQEVCF